MAEHIDGERRIGLRIAGSQEPEPAGPVRRAGDHKASLCGGQHLAQGLPRLERALVLVKSPAKVG